MLGTCKLVLPQYGLCPLGKVNVLNGTMLDMEESTIFRRCYLSCRLVMILHLSVSLCFCLYHLQVLSWLLLGTPLEACKGSA